MITYPYDKYDCLIPSVFKKIKVTLDERHEIKKNNNRLLANTKRKITEEDIKLIVNEYFKDLAIWLEEPTTTIFDLGNLGRISLNHLGLENFLKRILIPQYRTSSLESRPLISKRIKYIWKLRQLKYYKPRIGIANKWYIKAMEEKAKRQPNPLYGDMFDIKLPKLSNRLLSNALSDNMDRKAFLDLLETNKI